MPGTREGGIRSAATNRARYGLEFYHIIGADGGRKSRGGGFSDVKLAKRAGSKGGKASVRARRRKRAEAAAPTGRRDQARDANGRFVRQASPTRISPLWIDEVAAQVRVSPLVTLPVDEMTARESSRIRLELVLAAGYLTLCLLAGMLGGFLGARWGL